eukprot:COSAG01_NODE_68235_length_264_cov_1.866667_1_plen_25_part_10
MCYLLHVKSVNIGIAKHRLFSVNPE